MSERAINEIFQLIESSSFKQCNLKVGQLRTQFPKSSYFKVLDLYVKYKQSPTKFKFDTSALNESYGLKGTEVTSDTKALDLLHTFFIEIERYEEALNVYERASFKYSSFEVNYFWFDKALSDFNFKQMSKAALQLTKFNPNSEKFNSSRDFHVWYAICILALFKFNKSQISKQELAILPQLAYKSLSSIKPFQTTEELIVFCNICEALFPDDKEKSNEIIELILPELKTEVNLYLKNFLLKHLDEDDYQTMYDNCKKLLSHIDDFEVIKKFILSAKELNISQSDSKNQLLDLVGDSRNYRLSLFESDLIYNKLVSTKSLTFYLEKFHNKQCCVVDIKNYLNHLQELDLKQIFDSLDDSDVNHDVNLFQLDLISMTSTEIYQKHEKQLEKKPVTDYSTSSFMIIDLVKKHLLKENPSLTDILFSIQLLEGYQKKDIHNFDTKVWLIALYMYIGCTPLAFAHYEDLHIKNVQNDTVGHLVFSRFSTLFPQKSHQFYTKILDNKENFYNMSLERFPSILRISFEKKAYSKIIGMLEFWMKLENSSTRWIQTTELIQLTRLCNDKRATLLKDMHVQINRNDMLGYNEYSDNRDFDMFNIGKIEDISSLPNIFNFMKIDSNWITLSCIRELMIEAIPLYNKTDKIGKLLKSLNVEQELDVSFSSIEKWSFNIFYDIYQNDGNNLLTLLKENISMSSNTWTMIHEYLTIISTLKTLDNMKRIKDKNIKSTIKEKLHTLRDSIDEQFIEYEKSIKETWKNIEGDEHGVLLRQLGFEGTTSDNLVNHLLSVRKTVRNL